MSSVIMARQIVVLAVLLAGVCLEHSMALNDDTQGGLSSAAFAAQKRGSRRIQRDRYNMGYLFGKRSGTEDATAALLKTLARKAISVEDLSSSLQTDPALALRVARHLDRNGDGFVSISELL